jgi:hypothetical protein
MMREHAAPLNRRAVGAPGGSAIFVLLGETAGCKMEQKKDTILLDE